MFMTFSKNREFKFKLSNFFMPNWIATSDWQRLMASTRAEEATWDGFADRYDYCLKKDLQS